MNDKRTSVTAMCLTAILAVSPAVRFAQGTTFSGEAVALKASVLGVSLALADAGRCQPARQPEQLGGQRQRRGHSFGKHAEQLDFG